ncbi:PTS sugar transporter subunit IIB [Thermaerobacter sp. PB12/4term]|uniref:PTS system mannose/fructose/N-acetylgalactosamine-transporter subunit IIB n=1 Tax=Thermaerobacter sp. PB12/4term TaxID=2293838 RepID=UPI000E32B1C2|nr:PTS sugar transporter subunit IIB [Thermaerobacter sp. PB12/4term]QIA26713.1 PTS sugar transporter subunit IIB [Thermaerobacter sp. PB12/4term]
MPVLHVRIDNRLIHGQVAVAWSKHIGAKTLIVSSDEVARDEFQVAILKAVAPPGLKVEILDAAATVAYAKAHPGEGLFLLCKGPGDVLALVDRGLDIREVNIGNMAFVVGAKAVTRSVYVTPEQAAIFAALAGRGVRLVSQMMPADRPADFMALLRDAGLVPG